MLLLNAALDDEADVRSSCCCRNRLDRSSRDESFEPPSLSCALTSGGAASSPLGSGRRDDAFLLPVLISSSPLYLSEAATSSTTFRGLVPVLTFSLAGTGSTWVWVGDRCRSSLFLSRLSSVEERSLTLLVRLGWVRSSRCFASR